MRNLLVVFIMLLSGLSAESGDKQSADYLSPSCMVCDPAKDILYVSLSTAGKILIFDTKRGEAVDEIPLGINPAGIALSRNANTLYVAGGSENGKLLFIDPVNKEIKKVIPLGHTPGDMELSPDGDRLYITNRFSDCVSVVNTGQESEIKRIKVSREPSAIAVSADGNFVFVANLLLAGISNGKYASALISVINSSSLKVQHEIRLPNGSNALNDIAVSPGGNYVYVTHLLARYQLPTTQLERGWMNTNAVSVIENNRYINTVLLDDIDRGAANPWGIAFSQDGNKLFVVLSGTDELCIIDRNELHQKLGREIFNKERNVKVSDDISFTSGFKKRIKLKGKGFRYILAKGDDLFLTSRFSGSLISYNYHTGMTESYQLPGGSKDISLQREGEILFHDANISFQGWQSCVSCHPGDARVDGLNWDLLNDGMGNPKNTKSLLLAHETPPAMITGVRADAETAVRSGIRYILFSERPEEEAVAIDAYLKSLAPVPSPFLKDGQLSRNAQKGRKIYNRAKCDHCHCGPNYTNMKKYDVGTSVTSDMKKYDAGTSVNSDMKKHDAGTSVETDMKKYVVGTSVNSDMKRYDAGTSVETDMKKYDAGTSVNSDMKNHDAGTLMNSDMKKYDVGTSVTSDMKNHDAGTSVESEGVLFDTPGLKEIWRTAPYLNDGRAATVKDIFTKFNNNDKHGVTSDLTEKQIDLLVEYVLSL